MYGFDWFKSLMFSVFSQQQWEQNLTGFLEGKTKFCSGTRIWRFKGLSGYHRARVQSQIWKMQPQLLTKIKSDLQSFHKTLSASQFYQGGDPSAFSLLSSHLLENWAWKSGGAYFVAEEVWLGSEAPKGQGVEWAERAGKGWQGGDPLESAAGCPRLETLGCAVTEYLWNASTELRLTEGSSHGFSSAEVLRIC